MNKFQENSNRLTVGLLLLIISFVFFSPPLHALEYDPLKPNIKDVINGTTDGDPWNDLQTYDPPPSGDFNITTILRMYILKKIENQSICVPHLFLILPLPTANIIS